MNISDATSLSTVLVVDDETGSQDAIRRTLEEDFKVLTASSAEQDAAEDDFGTVSCVWSRHSAGWK